MWLSSDQSSKKSVEENIRKARGAFFARGQLGIFHGMLNPLSSRTIFESCVIPTLLYGAELWSLNISLLSALESFQSDLGKKMLKLPKSTAHNIPLLAMELPTTRSRILFIKLTFLHKLVNGDNSLCSQAFRSLAATDEESTLIVRQCHLLELTYSSNLTSTVLNSEDLSPKSKRKNPTTSLHFHPQKC